MTVDEYMRIGQLGVETATFVAAPILVLGLVSGLVVSIFQAATQISDASLAFIPKIVSTMVGLLIFGHFMIDKLASFTTWMYTQIGLMGG